MAPRWRTLVTRGRFWESIAPQPLFSAWGENCDPFTSCCHVIPTTANSPSRTIGQNKLFQKLVLLLHFITAAEGIGVYHQTSKLSARRRTQCQEHALRVDAKLPPIFSFSAYLWPASRPLRSAILLRQQKPSRLNLEDLTKGPRGSVYTPMFPGKGNRVICTFLEEWFLGKIYHFNAKLNI